MFAASILLACSLVAAPVPAQPAPPANGPARTLVVRAAGLARYRLAANVVLLLAGLDPDSRPVLAGALRPGDDRSRDALWAQLMTGAVQVVRTDGDRAVSVWFNPLFDGGLVVEWRFAHEEWSAVRAAFVLGKDLRGPDMPARRFDDAAVATLRAAAAMPLDAPPEDTDAAATLAARISAADLSLSQIYATPGYRYARLAARRVLAFSDPSTLPARPELKRALTLLGPDARAALRPVLAYRRSGGWTLAMQTPNAPAVTLFAHFRDPSPGAAPEARLAGVTLVDDIAERIGR